MTIINLGASGVGRWIRLKGAVHVPFCAAMVAPFDMALRSHEGWHHCEGAGWWGLIHGILMILFLGFVIALIVWGIKRLTECHEPDSNRVKGIDALEVAKLRYARGEISREEFEQIKKDLS